MFSIKNILKAGVYIGIVLLAVLLIVTQKGFDRSKLFAGMPQSSFYKAKVLSVTESLDKKASLRNGFQRLSLEFIDGPEVGKKLQIEYDAQNVSELRHKKGDKIVVMREKDPSGVSQYFISDKYRLPSIIFVIFAFIFLAFAIAGWKGFGSILGLLISLGIIFSYILPQILLGADPLTVCLTGAVIILLLTTYIAHGISLQTTVALFSSLIALLCTYILAVFVAKVSLLTGYGSEDAASLRFGPTSVINLKGLLLGGIIISTIGALNDITTTQASTVFQLFKMSPRITFSELYTKGFEVGREHAISIINTLVLAYAGASLALFIFLFYNPQHWPFWVILNSEVLSEEIIKTVAATAGLLLSVPLVTLVATGVCNKRLRKLTKDILYSLK